MQPKWGDRVEEYGEHGENESRDLPFSPISFICGISGAYTNDDAHIGIPIVLEPAPCCETKHHGFGDDEREDA
jgi:hypothetical protein